MATKERLQDYLTVTGTLILELHSNVCDYLLILINYKLITSCILYQCTSLHKDQTAIDDQVCFLTHLRNY